MSHMLHENDPMLLRELKKDGYFVWWGGKNDVVPVQDGFDDYCHVKYKPVKQLEKDFHHHQEWRGSPEDDTFHSFFKGKIDQKDESEVYYDYDWANVLGAIEQLKNLPDDSPFCIHLPLMFPHPPLAVEEPWFSIIDRSKIKPRIPEPEDWSGKASMLRGICVNHRMETWSEERWTELRAVMYGMCARLDAQFGMIADTLKEIGEYDNTAIFFYSDHSAYVGDYGVVDLSQNTFEDVLTNVPLIIKPPKGVPVKPGVRDCLTEMVDFKATVEDLCSLKPTHSQFGRSLLPVISGAVKEHRDAVFTEGGRLHDEPHCMELEHEAGHTDPNDLYYPRLILQASEGPEHTKAAMCRTKTHKYILNLNHTVVFTNVLTRNQGNSILASWIETGKTNKTAAGRAMAYQYRPAEELYDMRNDPWELNNLADDPKYAALKKELRKALDEWMAQQGDEGIETELQANSRQGRGDKKKPAARTKKGGRK